MEFPTSGGREVVSSNLIIPTIRILAISQLSVFYRSFTTLQRIAEHCRTLHNLANPLQMGL